jgi:uncharacterized protein
MFLDLTRIQGFREHVDRVYDAAAFETGHDDFLVTSDVRLSFDVEKKGDRYRLTGRAVSTLGMTCSRCAEPFTWPVDAAFDLTYLPQSANTGEGDREIAEEDLDSAFYAGEAIDLGQLLREQFYLSLPMKPLCSATCRGLCPVCGINRNSATCGCDAHWDDPRLAPLRGLLGRRQESQ